MKRQPPEGLQQPNLFPELDEEDLKREEQRKKEQAAEPYVKSAIIGIERSADFPDTANSEFYMILEYSLRSLEKRGATPEQLERVQQAAREGRKRREASGVPWNRYTGD